MLLEAILLHEKPLEREVTKLVDVLEDKLAGNLVALEELGEEGAADGVILRHRSEKFNHLSQVVVRLTIVRTLARVEQEVTSDQFKGHAGE